MRKRFVLCLVAMLIIMSFTGCSGSKKSVENGKFVITKEDLLYRVNQSIEDNGNQYPKFEEFQKPKYIETNGLYSADASLGLKMNVQYDHNETCIESISIGCYSNMTAENVNAAGAYQVFLLRALHPDITQDELMMVLEDLSVGTTTYDGVEYISVFEPYTAVFTQAKPVAQ